MPVVHSTHKMCWKDSHQINNPFPTAIFPPHLTILIDTDFKCINPDFYKFTKTRFFPLTLSSFTFTHHYQPLQEAEK